MNEFGQRVQTVAPATPVEVLGLEGVPAAGDQFQVVDDIVKAQQIGQFRQSKARVMALARTAARGLDQLAMQMKTGEVKELLVILKADVQGSVEVLKDTLTKTLDREGQSPHHPRGRRRDHLRRRAAGQRLQRHRDRRGHGDHQFNVRPDPRRRRAKQENVDIRLHSIIYEAEEEIAIDVVADGGHTLEETSSARPKSATSSACRRSAPVAGCMVTNGLIKRTAHAPPDPRHRGRPRATSAACAASRRTPAKCSRDTSAA